MINREKQSGAVLLAFMLLLIVGAGYALVSRLNATAILNAQYEHDARVLAEAKQALIAYAVTHSDIVDVNNANYGRLPCPDVDETGVVSEGGAHGTCGVRNVNSLGRLPWRTLSLEPLKDSSGECLWYAVSSQYKHSGSSSPQMLNSDTNGTFRIYANNGEVIAGDEPDDRPVAVVIAPGNVVGNQNRSLITGAEVCGGNYVASNYLEPEFPDNPNAGIENYRLHPDADQIDDFYLGGNENKEFINDKFIYISKHDIWDAIQERSDINYINNTNTDIENFMQWVGACIVKYSNESGDNPSIPYPAPIDLGFDIDSRDYRVSEQYIDIDGSGQEWLVGRLPDNVMQSSEIKGDSDYTNLISGSACNIGPDAGKYIEMWENWKDHIFYALSDRYKPVEIWPDDGVERYENSACDGFGYDPDWPEWFINIVHSFCGDYAASPLTCELDNCLHSEDESEFYAGIIIFSGTADSDQQRRNIRIDVPPLMSPDDRSLFSNYIRPPLLDHFVSRDNGDEDIIYLAGNPGTPDGNAPSLGAIDPDILAYCLVTSTVNNQISSVERCLTP